MDCVQIIINKTSVLYFSPLPAACKHPQAEQALQAMQMKLACLSSKSGITKCLNQFFGLCTESQEECSDKSFCCYARGMPKSGRGLVTNSIGHKWWEGEQLFLQ